MKAPTFGGGTLRTEFEVLTGIPMDAYPRIDFPYLQISQKTIPSLVGVLHEDGYKAYAVHGNSGGFWNRAKAFKEMGFDRFFTKSDFPAGAKLDGWFLSDEAMTDKIIDLLGDASSPTLIFAVSIEGHGPYDHVPVSDAARRDELPVPAGWPAAAVNEYKNYLYHITNADQQLGRLWAYLESRHRPYVLAFYGDHLPGLQHVYAIHGFDDQSDGRSEFVPWFVVSSSQTSAPSKHIFSWMLGAEILDAAGLPRPPYYQALGAAERLLAGNADAARKVTVENGIYSTARLYLNGRFDRDMPKIEAKETSQ
jgi:phosphoglycerol transferase MdoB-like AlkP superfamily enzyme